MTTFQLLGLDGRGVAVVGSIQSCLPQVGLDWRGAKTRFSAHNKRPCCAVLCACAREVTGAPRGREIYAWGALLLRLAPC